MKVFDKIYCHKDYIHEGEQWLTNGEKYIIIDIYNKYYMYIIDNQGDRNCISLDKKEDADRYFNDYFYTMKELRKQKLKKLNERR
jgi:hypothetical protein